MPIAAIGLGLGTAIAGAAAGGASIYGAHKTSSAANRAADLTTQAANHGADLQKQAADDALAFQKSQADAKAKQDEIDRRANYDQWAAGMDQHNRVRAALGYPTVPIPPYVPGATPTFSGPPAPTRPPVSPNSIGGALLFPSAPSPAPMSGLPPTLRPTSGPASGRMAPGAPSVGGALYNTPNTGFVGPMWPMDPATGLKRPPSVGASLMGVR